MSIDPILIPIRDWFYQYFGLMCTLLIQAPTSVVSVSSGQVLSYTLHCATNSSWMLPCNAASVCPPIWPLADLSSLQAVRRREACVFPKSCRPALDRRRTFTLRRSCTTPLSWWRQKTTATSWWRCVCIPTTSNPVLLSSWSCLFGTLNQISIVWNLCCSRRLWLSGNPPLLFGHLFCPKKYFLVLWRPRFNLLPLFILDLADPAAALPTWAQPRTRWV